MITHKVFRLAAIAVIVAALFVSVAIQPAQSLSLQGYILRAPWETLTVDEDLDAHDNLSVVFGGPHQIPIMSYESSTYYSMNYLNPGTGEWDLGYYATDVKDGSFSPMAEHTFINSFKIGWAFELPDQQEIRVYSREYSQDMVYLTNSIGRIYDLGDNKYVAGQPSLAFDSGGNPHVVVIIGNSSTFMRSLVYIKESAEEQDSCGTYSYWECQTIRSGLMESFGTHPGIVLTEAGNPRISFYDGTTNSLTYAYPGGWNSNCGPGGDTWRCVAISTSVQSGSDIDLDISHKSTRPQLVWTNTDGLSQTWVHHARYVGSGGNCGQDYRLTPTGYELDELWDCHQTSEIGYDVDYANVAIAVDDANTGIIAHDVLGSLGSYDLGVTYAYADGTFVYQPVDTPRIIDTGINADITIDANGRGLIGYFDEGTGSYLRVALQNNILFIPFIVK